MKKIVFNSELIDKLEAYQIGALARLINNYDGGREFKSAEFRKECVGMSTTRFYQVINRFQGLGILNKSRTQSDTIWIINWSLIRGEDE